MSLPNPLSIPGSWDRDSPQTEERNPIESESIPRTAIGVVGDAGEILDQNGKAIGRISESKDPQNHMGKAVTETGDIVDSSSKVLDKAVLDNDGGSEYTTRSASDGEKSTGGWNILGKTKAAYQTFDSLHKPVTRGFNIVGELRKKSESKTKAGEDIGPVERAQESHLQQEEAPGIKTTQQVNTGEQDQSVEQAFSKGAHGQETKNLEEEPRHDVVTSSDEPKVEAKCVELVPKDETCQKSREGVLGSEEAEMPREKDASETDLGAGSQKDTEKEIPQEELQQQQRQETPVDDLSPRDVQGQEHLQGVRGPGEEFTKAVEASGTRGLSEQEADTRSLLEATEEVAKPSETKDLVENETGVVAANGEEEVKEEISGEEGAKVSGGGEETNEGEDVQGQKETGIESTEDLATPPGTKDSFEKETGVIATSGEQEAREEISGGEETKEGDVQGQEETGIDYSALKGTTVNKAGNLVNRNGDVIGRLIEGDPKQLLGKNADENGDIWDDSGKVIGRGEPLPDSEREDQKEFAPFENFPDATVEGDGRVVSNGQQVGIVVDGDTKRLKGSHVDEDGDILDRRGNVIGKAEPWDQPEPEPEPEVDRSMLAGKRVNKAGNVVDSSGAIFGRVVEGNMSTLVGRMCDKDGNVRSESGDVIGKAEVIPEGEREGFREGPFAELSGCTVAKDGKIVTPAGDVVGRLVTGDPKTLFGRAVDQDGDVLDLNGNVLAKAERWEEPEVEKKVSPLSGRKVNREGNVLDEDGNVIGRLVSGEIAICSGKEVDEDGDVMNSKGNPIGHVALVEDIPTESPEEKEKREKAEEDRKLAGILAGLIEQALDKIRPICKLITDKIDTAERTPKEELDEEQLVREVKPLIEEGGKILTETNGAIRGLDPDGRIQRNAKHKAGTKEATPEEHHLVDVLKELTGTVTETIDNAKRKIEGMPHAKKELNPLWGLLAEPLFQIIAAVGLLLTGVLGLVGRLLHGLGLGGLVDSLLGGLGLTRILDGLGLGIVVDSLTGKDKKKK